MPATFFRMHLFFMALNCFDFVTLASHLRALHSLCSPILSLTFSEM